MTDTQYLARRYGRSNARKDLRTQKWMPEEQQNS
jgi:hypothetical protein